MILTHPEGDVLIDWKTGSAGGSEFQLKFYLMLRYLETVQAPRHAEAISLSGSEPLCVSWSDELPAWFEAKLEQMARNLEACRTRDAKLGRHCAHCPCAHACKVSEASERRLLDTFTGEVIHFGQA